MSYAAVARQGSRYREAEVASASPGQLVLIIYDHVLVNLARARLRAGDVDGSARSEALDRARAGVTELLVTLDREKGGEIAGNLASLYTFWLSELSVLGVKPKVERLDAISAMVTDLRAAFAEAMTLATPVTSRAVS
ncbi:MAG: flagellar export chaperone FliS [Gemmatimonadaceae bacterium]|nr:flagellar export chaperone FliS [Gemmatimonadaceae bacterium]